MIKKSDLALTPGLRLTLLLCIFIVCYIIALLTVQLTLHLCAEKTVAGMRISAVIQDVVSFILPAIATAVIVTRRPAELLCLQRGISSARVYVLIPVILLVSIPVQEAVIYWNNNLSLPASMASLETSLRTMEKASSELMLKMLSDTSVAALIINILVIGVAAGFSEELLFRGCFQRLLTTGGVNRHAAVWTVAAVFSAMHMQFFGFVPRMLLGAWFGYMLLWSGSIWMPMLAHALNNSFFIVTAWYSLRTNPDTPLDDDGILMPAIDILAGAVATAFALAAMRRRCLGYKKNAGTVSSTNKSE